MTLAPVTVRLVRRAASVDGELVSGLRGTARFVQTLPLATLLNHYNLASEPTRDEERAG